VLFMLAILNMLLKFVDEKAEEVGVIEKERKGDIYA